MEVAWEVMIVGNMSLPMLQPLPDEPRKWQMRIRAYLPALKMAGYSQEAGGILPLVVLFCENVYGGNFM